MCLGPSIGGQLSLLPQQGVEAAMQAEPESYPEGLQRGECLCQSSFLFLGPLRLCGLVLIGCCGGMTHIYGAIYNKRIL